MPRVLAAREATRPSLSSSHQAQHENVRRQHRALLVSAQAAANEVDVAVIGGGIIGLCVALELLTHASQPSVALIERQAPCSGATGAGALST